MGTLRQHRKPRQSWTRHPWALPVIGRPRPENPRVGGSTPSQATTPQQVTSVAGGALWPHFAHAAGALVLLGALLFLGAAPAGAADGLTLGVLGAAAADLGTTQWAFARVPGAHDANPAVRGPASAVLVKAGTTAGVLLLDRHLQRTGHRRAGKVLKIAAIVAWGSCAAWNARQIARHGGAR
jgi:hypothetical protein